MPPPSKFLSFSRHAALTLKPRHGRSSTLGFVFALAFFALALRAAWVQCYDASFYQHQGEIRQVSDRGLPAARGRILDRNGSVLAMSIPTDTVWVDAASTSQLASASQVQALAHLLQIEPSAIDAAFASHRQFVYLARQIPTDVAALTQQLNVPGVFYRPDSRRFYPEAGITANIVGYSGIDGKGQEGIERTAEPLLHGANGRVDVLHDARGNAIENLTRLAPQNGNDIHLSIDLPIQYAAYQALQDTVTRFAAKSGSAIVIDPHTGEILAMANWPSYDPNSRTRSDPQAIRNRAATDAFEPGSVMKPLTIALAIQQQRVTPDSIVTTEGGKLNLDGQTIHDDADFGTLTVAGVIQKSSNVGTSKISMLLSARDMWHNFRNLGLGLAPHAGLPGEAAGTVRDWHHWRRIEQATMAYGYGLSASLLQLAQAYTTFANDGVFVPATIFQQHAPVTGKRIFSVKTAQSVRAMMENVVSKGGTASQVVVPGYTVAAKTGTAYRWTQHGYDYHQYRASFVGLIPAQHPRVIIAVSIESPTKGSHFGGAVAGSAFEAIASPTMTRLRVEPDADVTAHR